MNKLILTYDEYDFIEEICDRIHERCETEKASSRKHYSETEKFPRVADMEAVDVDKNFKKYYKYLMYYYFNPIIVPDSLKEEYNESMAYIKKLVNSHIEFAEEDGEEILEN